MPEVSFDPAAPVIVLPVKLEGRIIETAHMAVDTGATYVMIPFITLKSVRLADLEAKSVKALVHDLPPRSFVDGLLGLSFLRNFRFCLDFKRGLLELYSR